MVTGFFAEFGHCYGSYRAIGRYRKHGVKVVKTMKLRLPAALFAAPLLALSLTSAPAFAAHQTASFDGLDFGDDAGASARDGACDDMRFTGEGMTATPLAPDDIFRDASDCAAAFASGKVELSPIFIRLSGAGAIDWGDDGSQFANDGECDDLRFEGPGLTETPLIIEDVGHDASDCRAAYAAGKVRWRTGAISAIDARLIIA